MTSRSIVVFPEFLSLAADLPKETKVKLFRILRQLSNDVRHPGLQTKKIQGTKAEVFECRVDNSIRMVYDLNDQNLRCWYVGPHDDAINYGSRLGRAGQVDDISASDIPECVRSLTHFLQKGTVSRTFVGLELPE